MKNSKKIVAMVLCVLILVLPILSQCFIAAHREHICTGTKHCPVCIEIHIAEQVITNLKTILLAVAFAMLTICAFALSLIYERQIHRVSETLITLKVELLN